MFIDFARVSMVSHLVQGMPYFASCALFQLTGYDSFAYEWLLRNVMWTLRYNSVTVH